MAEFSDVGGVCSVPTCGTHDFLAFTCDACSKPFCQEHYTCSAHDCLAAVRGSGSPQARSVSDSPRPQALKCAAKGCKEVLGPHNKVRCWRCRQDVCIRHRFEEDHECASVDYAVSAALTAARTSMTPAEFVEAHATLQKVFGNIIREPTNEKFRSLKKANAVVSQKLKHPACVEALKLCGFVDVGEAYTCSMVADLTLMRQMTAALEAHPPASVSAEATRPSPAASAGVSPATGGARVVNGVIVRPDYSPATAAPSGGAAAPSAPSAAAAASRPRAVGKFERRVDTKKAEQAQAQSLQELRQMQKEKFKAAEATGTRASAAASSEADAPLSDSEAGSSRITMVNGSARSFRPTSDGDCCLQ